MDKKKPFGSWRQNLGGLFALIALFGAWSLFSTVDESGSFTRLYDYAVLAVGIVGFIATMLWPRKTKKPYGES